jgi:hypothetical protein
MKRLFIYLLFPIGAMASTERFSLKTGHQITLNIPQGWETAKDLFGLPLTILGPFSNESRPVLGVVPTKVKSEKMPEKEFKQFFDDFRKEKEEWVRSNKGELIDFDPTKSVEFKNARGHFIGAEFKINNVTFLERSYYLFCKGELYNLKYSIRDEHKKYLSDLQKMVEEFKCE